MKKLIIGLLGESKTGKDWLGKNLVNNLDYNYDPKTGLLKAADILKIEAEKRYPGIFITKDWEESGDDYREIIVPEIKISRRQILQDVGQELIKENPNYVYDYLTDSIKNSSSELVLITDIRNTLESSAIVDSGGIIIKVKRHLKYRYPEVWKTYEKSHTHSLLSSITGFLSYIENRNSSLYKKLHHTTELSVNEVPNKLITYKIINEPKKERELQSLILKLRSI